MFLSILLAATIAASSGWTAKTSDGVTTMTPAKLGAGEVALIEVHPVAKARDPRAWVEEAWKAFKKPYTGLQDESMTQQKNPAGLVSITAAASMLDSANRELFVVLYGVGQASRIQPVLFVGGSIRAFREYASAAAKLVNAISTIGSLGNGTFVSRLHPFLPGATAPGITAAVAAATPLPAGPNDFRTDRPNGVFLADHHVIAEGVDVSLIGEWREDLKHITLRLRQDGAYSPRTGAAVAYVNSYTGAFNNAVGANETETGTWTFAAGVLTLKPASRKAAGVTGYGPATLYTAKEPDPPCLLHVTGVTIQYTPLDTNLIRTRPGPHVKGPAPPGEGEAWDVILRSAPWSG